LILRHQFAVVQRRQPHRPNVNWADRALLTTLPGVIPKARRQRLRLLITPDTILHWHRDIARRRCGDLGVERVIGNEHRASLQMDTEQSDGPDRNP
jgi:hypothetical protein